MDEPIDKQTRLICKHCGAELSAIAKICPKCRYSHNEFWYKLERFVYFISIAMLMFSAITLFFTQQQKREATQALTSATEAKEKIDSIYIELKTKSDSLEGYFSSLTKDVKKQQYLDNLRSRAIGTHDRNAFDELNDLNNYPIYKSALIATRNQVLQYWLEMGTPVDDHKILLPIEGDTATTEEKLQTISLAKILLLDNNYESRLKSIIHLGNKQSDKNAEKILLLSLFGDNDIEVALRCKGNLKWLIGYPKENEFLEVDNIYNWWKEKNINTYKVDTSFKPLLIEYRDHLKKKKMISKNKYEILRLGKAINLVKSFI
ncbi:MAG: zinc ribbon domain-containing protein [bacterium]|nr:zinc ribbon domain-containing protein [bacterium]